MPPSIWAWMTSGLTAMPQSTAHQTLCTFGAPSVADRHLDDLRDEGVEALATATPRARPFGSFAPFQSAISAPRCSTPACARLVGSSSSRPSSGSMPAASSNSSRKVSIAKAVCVEPTERHHSVGTPTSTMCAAAQVGDR